MVACIPRLVVTELILRLLVLFVVTDREWLIQVVRIVFVHMVNAVRVVSFSHLFASSLLIGVCLTAAVLVLFRERRLHVDLHKVLLLNLIPSRSTLFACSDTFDLLCLVVLYNQINQLAVVRFHCHS